MAIHGLKTWWYSICSWRFQRNTKSLVFICGELNHNPKPSICFCPPHIYFPFHQEGQHDLLLLIGCQLGSGPRLSLSLPGCRKTIYIYIYNWPQVQVCLLPQCCWWPFATLSSLLTRSLTECCINLCASQVILKQRSIFQPLTSETSLWHPIKHFVD